MTPRHVAPQAILAAGVGLLFACTGPQGPAGPRGDQGPEGPQGDPGISSGTVKGTVTSSLGPAEGVAISSEPDAGAIATTDAEGKYTLVLPIGVYTIASEENANFAGHAVEGVSVAAGATVIVDHAIAAKNPLAVTVTAPAAPAGLGASVTLTAAVTGAPSGATPAFGWTQTAGPAVTLSGASTASASFTTRKLGDLIGTAATDLAWPLRHGILGIASQQQTQLSYTFKVTVTAGGFTKDATVTVKSAPWSTSNHVAPLGTRVVLAAPQQDAYAWTLTRPGGSSAALDFPSERAASFVPDVEGEYTVGEGTWTRLVVGARYVGVDANCKNCHNSADSPQYAEWQTSKHATKFTRGINGEDSPYYNKSCLTCHTAGYDPSAVNGGFDEVATQAGWSFPAALAPANWDAAPAQVKNLANIQCENCHGPGSQHGGNAAHISRNWSAAVCESCHYALPYHDRGMLFNLSGHANLELALEEATVEERAASAAHCGRCHGAQGFVYYLKQQEGTCKNVAGAIRNIVKPDCSAADTAFLSSLGLMEDEVQSQTCQACHNPHTGKLRVEGDTYLLPAGFQAKGVGKGALCMSCHNSRNGLHEDPAPPASFSAPHASSQADVLMGRNAYFVGGYNISRHAAIENTCATCHVEIVGEGVVPGYAPVRHNNHTFRANLTICADCHAESVTGEAIQEEFERGMGDVAWEAGRVLLDALNDLGEDLKVRAWNPVTDAYSSTSSSASNVVVSASQLPATPAGVDFSTEIHGQQSVRLTLTSPVNVTFTGDATPTAVTDLYFQLGSLKKTSDSSTVFAANSVLVKALWNWYLLHGEGSKGIHNPSFEYDVLYATLLELRAQ